MLPSPIEIDVDGKTYQVGTLDAMKQFHVARRVAPIQVAMGTTFFDMMKKAGEGVKNTDVASTLMGSAMEVVSKMSDADSNFVITTCLSVVKRKEGDNRWAPTMVGERMMFQDMGLQTLLALVTEVVRSNLGDFFSPAPDDKS